MSDSEARSGDQDQRSYYRVPTFLPVRCRRVGASELAALEAEILTHESFDVSNVDPGLCEWLDRIEGKLDRILAHYESEDGRWITPEGPLELTLSGSGIRLPVTQEVAVGTNVLLEIVLPGTPKQVIRCIGEVAKSDDDEKGPAIAAGFRVIAESDRDAVVGHVLQVQRSELRRRASGDE